MRDRGKLIGWGMDSCHDVLKDFIVYAPVYERGNPVHSPEFKRLPGFPNAHYYAALAALKLTGAAEIPAEFRHFVLYYDCVYVREELPLEEPA